MSGQPILTIVGNLTDDPQLRYLESGVALARITVASTPRVFDKTKGEYGDGEPLFVTCTAWRTLAENIAESLSKGTRVVVTGRLRQSRWQTDTGEHRSTFGLDVDEIGPSLRFAQASVKKLTRSGGHGPVAATAPDDPWASALPSRPDQGAAGSFDDAPPF